MTEPSITCISCNLTSYNPGDVTNEYCGNCHSEHRGSIVWRADGDTEVLTGYVGSAAMFQITSAGVGRYALGTVQMTSIFYDHSGRYEAGSHGFSQINEAKMWASILMARLVRKLFFSRPPQAASGAPPESEELVPRQMASRVRRALELFDEGVIDVPELNAVVEELQQQYGVDAQLPADQEGH